jgi:hypothetical protein
LEVADSEAIVRIDGNLETAIAWFPESQALVHWNGKSFVRTAVPEFSREGVVTSVRKLDGYTASLLVAKPDGTIVRFVISLRTGDLKSSITVPSASGAAFEDGARIFCFNKGKLSVVSQAGETLQVLSLAVDDGLKIEQASSRCLHLSTRMPGQDWLLHTDGNDLHLYRLPGPRKNTPAVNGTQPESPK